MKKYPKQFGFFQKALGSGKTAHAYIFYGPKGESKKDFARFISQYFQCLNRTASGPCGECHHCHLAKTGTLVDTYMIDKGEEHILIEEVLEAQRNVNLSRSKGEWKFLIINNAERMTDGKTKDVLLKTLEEPPAQSIIILVTDDKSKMPATVLSRSQSIYFHESSPLDEEEIGEAIAICRDLVSQKSFPKMTRAKELAEAEDSRSSLEKMIRVLRNLALDGQGVVEMTDLERKFWGGLEKTLQYGKIAEVLEKLLKARDVLESNVSKRVFFENLFIS